AGKTVRCAHPTSDGACQCALNVSTKDGYQVTTFRTRTEVTTRTLRNKETGILEVDPSTGMYRTEKTKAKVSCNTHHPLCVIKPLEELSPVGVPSLYPDMTNTIRKWYLRPVCMHSGTE
ncbi:hypothetical protein KIPB_013591, partial [Kipferlia bialata]